MSVPRVVALVGPTAAGKSALGMRLAEQLGLPVLCCDSVQVYRRLDIGSAKPTPSERARVRHELLDLVEPDASFSAGEWASACHEALTGPGQTEGEAGAGRGLVVGGTGLYLRSALLSFSHVDEGDPELRAAFDASWEAREADEPGAIWRGLQDIDPSAAADVHPNNASRALRYLWLCELLGTRISEFRAQHPPFKRMKLLMIVLDPGVGVVDAAIDARVDAMLEQGWLAEVEKLRDEGYDARHRAMRSLGYRELLDHLEGRFSLDEARDGIRKATRAYARRQRTYFRHQFSALPMENILQIADPDSCPSQRISDFLHAEAP